MNHNEGSAARSILCKLNRFKFSMSKYFRSSDEMSAIFVIIKLYSFSDVAEVMRRNRLRWFGHVERRDELCWIKRINTAGRW